MNFPNAHKGVKKIFVAEIFAIAAVIFLLCGAVFALALAKLSAEDEFAVSAIIALTTLLAGLGFGVASFVINLVGILQAKKDENYFYYAFVFVIIPIIASAFAAIFSKNAYVQSISDTVRNICEVVVMIFIIGGVKELAKKLGREDMVNSANLAYRIITAVYVLLMIARVTEVVFDFLPMMVTAAGILSIVAGVINVVAHVYYFVFLGRSVKMLKQ
ncbi:MAG: hypothetical protein IJT49_08780 [Clostridia bacterium]|nr:hypothetical protein [Clostridia bacterium]